MSWCGKSGTLNIIGFWSNTDNIKLEVQSRSQDRKILEAKVPVTVGSDFSQASAACHASTVPFDNSYIKTN